MLCKVDPSNQQVAVGLTIIMCSFNDELFLHIKGLSMRGGSAGTSVRDPESQEGGCEFLKSPIALAIGVLF